MMEGTKFIPEFVDRERKLIASVSSLPWSGAGRPPCIIGKDRQHVFMGQDGNVPGQMDNWNEIWYAQDAANNYPAALDEIERLRAEVERLTAERDAWKFYADTMRRDIEDLWEACDSIPHAPGCNGDYCECARSNFNSMLMTVYNHAQDSQP